MKQKEVDAFIERAKTAAISRIGTPLANENEAKMHAIVMRIVSLENEKKMMLETIERYRKLCRKHGLCLD